jgi:protein TonB
VHAGVLVSLPEGGGAGQGAGGGDIVTITASAAAYSGLIEAWERPPTTADQPVLRVPQADLAVPLGAAVDPTPVRPARPDLPNLSVETFPRVATAPAPALARVPRLSAPVLSLPETTGVAPLVAAAPDATPAFRPADLPSLADPAPAPEADTQTHFDGSTALAASVSPRPAQRPEGLAPVPAPRTDRAPSGAAGAPEPSDPAPARSAAGTGGGAAQGATSPAPQPGMSAAQVASLVGEWGGQIQSRIARSRPGVTGTGRAVVQLSVAPSGQLVALGIASSSGNPAIDQAALDAVRRAGRFPRAPAALTDASYSFSVPLTFQ